MDMNMFISSHFVSAAHPYHDQRSLNRCHNAVAMLVRK